MKEEMRELMLEVLSSSTIKRRGLFDAKAVRQLMEDNQQGKVDAAYTLFSLMCIELWCRRFVDSDLNLQRHSELVH